MIKYKYTIRSKYEPLLDGSPNFHQNEFVTVTNKTNDPMELLELLSANSEYKKGLSIIDFTYEITPNEL